MTITAPGYPLARAATRTRDWTRACAALFVCGWGGNQFTPLLDMYRAVNGWSTTLVDALLAAYVFGLIPALLLGGRISHRFGRRDTVAGAVSSSIVGSVLISTQAGAGVAVGRLLSGVGVGLAMAVGTTWAAELSVAAGARASSGAKRAALSLTAGFALGAGVAGALAQWGPWPESLPYAVHIAVSALVLVALLRLQALAPGESPVVSRADPDDPLHPHERSRRFRVLVVPMAPWVFGTAGVAYAILPEAMATHVGHYTLIYATVLTVLTLGMGILVQPLARRLDDPVTPHAMRAAMALVVAGLAIATAAVALGVPVLAAMAAAVLGAGYGIGLLAGLLEIQRIATPERLASLTGGFYAMTYIGFLLPAVLALLARAVPLVAELSLLTLLAGCSAAVISSHRSPVPPRTARPGQAACSSGAGATTASSSPSG